MSVPVPKLSARGQSAVTAALAVFAIIVLSPLADVIVPALPISSGEVRWRFQIFGGFLAALPQLAFVLATITAVGLLSGHRTAVRVTAFMTAFIAVTAAILLPFFVLDFLEMRRLVSLDRKGTFDLAALKTFAFGGFFVLTLGYLAVRAIAVGAKEKGTKERMSGRRPEGAGLVVGQD